ncbi:MAG: hypothetical protein ACI9OE_001930 [Mariniflexile sp.]|jgi:hypothetical protein
MTLKQFKVIATTLDAIIGLFLNQVLEFLEKFS